MKVLAVFGTRPEAIKMCPLVLQLQAAKGVNCEVCLTGQHREMLQQVIDIFSITPEYSLDVMREGQTLYDVTSEVLGRMRGPLEACKPDIVLVHGDTTTSFAAALAAFYQKIPVGHVEAGLRTWDRYSPFPEEMNRLMTSRLAQLHFAPTEGNRANLLAENTDGQIFVTGNTVIDAFHTTLREGYQFREPTLAKLSGQRRRILVTAHRRENLGGPLRHIFKAIKQLHDDFEDIQFVYPLHLNPKVRQPAEEMLGGLERVLLTGPLDVRDMHNLMAGCFFVMTDSGGLQEEAPYFGVPVLVLRNETERPEAVAAGTVKVVGADCQSIYSAAAQLITSPAAHAKMAGAVNPYGDGHACERIVQHLMEWFPSK